MNNEKQFSGFLFNIVNARNIVFIAMLAVGTLCIIMSSRNTAIIYHHLFTKEIRLLP